MNIIDGERGFIEKNLDFLPSNHLYVLILGLPQNFEKLTLMQFKILFIFVYFIDLGFLPRISRYIVHIITN